MWEENIFLVRSDGNMFPEFQLLSVLFSAFLSNDLISHYVSPLVREVSLIILFSYLYVLCRLLFG